MLRLAHRILSQQLSRPVGAVKSDPDGSLRKMEMSAIAEGPVVVIDNVARFFGEHEKTTWRYEDFPACRCPWPNVFFEFNFPDKWHCEGGTDGASNWQQLFKQVGFLVSSGSLSETVDGVDGFFRHHPAFVELSKSDPDASLMLLSLWCADASGRPCHSGIRYAVCSTSDGRVRNIGGLGRPWEVDEDWGAYASNLLFVVLLAISFANCKKTEQIDVTESEGPAAKWLRRTKLPRIQYRMLDIAPMRRVLAAEGNAAENGIQKALHICRGHFATYSDDHPLFGKYTGTFWKPAHVRGSAEHGAVVKDYSVSTKGGA